MRRHLNKHCSYIMKDNTLYLFLRKDNNTIYSILGYSLGRKIISMIDDSIPGTWVAAKRTGKFLMVWNYDKPDSNGKYWDEIELEAAMSGKADCPSSIFD